MATYYVDFATGSNSFNGLARATPWQHVRGMAGATGNAASTALGAGDVIVFKGGVTWDHTCFPLVPSANGLTFTVDTSWYSGGSFTKPVWDGEYLVADLVQLNGLSNITINNLELKRVTHPTSNFGYGLISGGSASNILISNCYLHGWRTGASTDDAHGGVIFNYGPSLTTVIDSCVLENSENAAAWNGVIARMVGVIRNSTLHDNSSAVLFCVDFDANDLFNIAIPSGSFDPTYHLNGVYLDPFTMNEAVGYIRNSLFHDVAGGTNMAYPNPHKATVHVYNNVFYGQISVQDPIEIDPYNYGTGSGGDVHCYNNTIYLADSAQTLGIHVVDRGGNPKLNLLVSRNNHVIGTGVSVDDATAAKVTTITRSNNLTQTAAVSASEGYTQGSLWRSNGSTLDTGFDGSAVLTTDRLGVTRPRGAAWDIGAYEWIPSTVPLTRSVSDNAQINPIATRLF